MVPTFRVGVHGGDVVVSEQGDTKRSIGIYGDTINIAARMEEAAKAHGVACVISGDVAEALEISSGRVRPLGEETIRGLVDPIVIYEYRPEDGSGDEGVGQRAPIPHAPGQNGMPDDFTVSG